MILYLDAKTNVPDVFIDYIEVMLKSGEIVSLNWDESDISREEDGFSARYKGVYFGENYANGKLDQLEGMAIADIGVYSEIDGTVPVSISITEMLFEDDGRELAFTRPLRYLNTAEFEYSAADLTGDVTKNIIFRVHKKWLRDQIGIDPDRDTCINLSRVLRSALSDPEKSGFQCPYAWTNEKGMLLPDKIIEAGFIPALDDLISDAKSHQANEGHITAPAQELSR